jgi:uncharacterized protein (TIGR03435 family)
VGRPVIDKTGLAGTYDYKLEWGDDVAARADADFTDSSAWSASSGICKALRRNAKNKIPNELLDTAQLGTDRQIVSLENDIKPP